MSDRKRPEPPVEVATDLSEVAQTRISGQAKDRLRRYAKESAMPEATAVRQLLYVALGLIRPNHRRLIRGRVS